MQYFDKEIVIYDLLFYALILWAISAAFLVVTSYSYPGFSAEKNSTPSYRSAEPSKKASANDHSVEEEPTTKFWVCDCGVKNRELASACSGCGQVRPHKSGSDDYVKCSCGAIVKKAEMCPLCGQMVY